MAIEPDHLFILTEAGAPQADLLVAAGLVEGSGNSHPGQGTANRRFFFANTTLEFLYVRDVAEAIGGPAKGLRIHDRLSTPGASPFGLVTRTVEENPGLPFDGWKYYPDYLPDDQGFHVGENSDLLEEPLCICMPDSLSRRKGAPTPGNPLWKLTETVIGLPMTDPSKPLRETLGGPAVSAELGTPHCLRLTFNEGAEGQSRDFRPALPLVIHW